MDREQIRHGLIDILRSGDQMSLQIDVSDITDESSLINDIALDSIQILEFIIAIENRFGFAIDTEEIDLDVFDRFSELVDYVATKVNG
jgi:acyl carrier protein